MSSRARRQFPACLISQYSPADERERNIIQKRGESFLVHPSVLVGEIGTLRMITCDEWRIIDGASQQMNGIKIKQLIVEGDTFSDQLALVSGFATGKLFD